MKRDVKQVLLISEPCRRRLANEFGMIRQCIDSAVDDFLYTTKKTGQILIGNGVSNRAVIAGQKPLPHHDLHPACFPEQVIRIMIKPTAFLKELHLVLQTIRHIHGPAVVPEI